MLNRLILTKQVAGEGEIGKSCNINPHIPDKKGNNGIK